MIAYRFAQENDLQSIMKVRFSVKENVLSNPDLVTIEDCREYIFNRGNGWVATENNVVVGFSIVDVIEHNVWALFVHPDFAQKGIGKKLHNLMLDWYFNQTQHSIWLGTDPGTRAETFYRTMGWQQIGMHGNEYKFEMTFERWSQQK